MTTTDTIEHLIEEEVRKGIEHFKNEYLNTSFEKNKLYNHLGKELVNLLKKYETFVAGGTITSLFANKEINDVDVYFRDKESLVRFLREIWNDQWVTSFTKKALLFTHNNIDVQLIYFNYFESPDEIFDTFDFTACMGCFDFKEEKFILHPDFLKHNSQRILKFNSNTAFPIVSLLRVHKYENKGYKISKPELIRIILTCMKLEIKTYDELKEHLGGMYGINYDKLFEDVKDEEFDLQKAIDKIANITQDEDYFVKPESIKFNRLEDIIEIIWDEPIKVFKVGDNKYKLTPWGIIDSVYKNLESEEVIDPKKHLNDFKIYKFVVPTDEEGVYSSFMSDEFKYEIGKVVEAWTEDDNDGRLYFNQQEDITSSTYFGREEGVLIEAEFDWDDLIDADDGTILVKRCKVIREVPKEEWENWI
jgi:hypothetical protein